jgi:hypothetical protein
MPAAARYLLAWVGSTLLLMGVVAAVNLIVDPYGLFRIVDVPGLNRIKSQAGERAALFKRTAVARMRPASVVLGNSRAEIGFDPDSPAWPADARPAFNLGLPGASIVAVAGEFDEVLRTASPKLAVVGLDFLDFRVDPSSDERFEASPSDADPLGDLRERASALFTLNALADSLATIRAQRDPYATGLTAAGFNPKRDYIGVARREGYFAMFRQRDQENARAYVRGPKSIFQAGGQPSPGFDAVDHIIALARTRGVALRFVLYPYHTHTLMLFELTGLWPAYEDWKREIVRRIDAARGAMDIELWDFTGFSPYTGERVPRPGDTRTELQWYWEAGHFKKSLGDKMLLDVFGAKDSDDHWGRRLTGANLEQVLQQARAERDDYRRRHEDDWRAMAELVEAAAARR